MTPRRIEFIVYLVGIALLGLFQQQFRAAIGVDALAFVVVIVYLLCLRALGWALSKLLVKHEQ
jgi:hypothetical protein